MEKAALNAVLMRPVSAMMMNHLPIMMVIAITVEAVHVLMDQLLLITNIVPIQTQIVVAMVFAIAVKVVVTVQVIVELVVSGQFVATRCVLVSNHA